MSDLFLITTKGFIKIDPAMVEKYHLVSGTVSPFTRWRISDEEGRENEREYEPEPAGREETVGELVNDGIAQLDNGMTLSHSEMLDFSQGTDSSNR